MTATENVVPFPQGDRHEVEAKKHDRSVAARWTKRLEHFVPVSQYFLENYHRLGGSKGLSSAEVMVIIHLMNHKWDGRAPFPTVGLLAKRMGVTDRAVRTVVKTLEGLGLLQRVYAPHGGPNRYHLEGLFQALEKMMDEDLKSQDQKGVA